MVLSAARFDAAPAAPPAGQAPAGPAVAWLRFWGPPEPTPRLTDGTVNLGRVPGSMIWNVPHINMACASLARMASRWPRSQPAVVVAVRGSGR
jgi:hypothetical protein